ncbi:MAG: hypothetical protein V4687_01045 [Bacteroidota bacterium]
MGGRPERPFKPLHVFPPSEHVPRSADLLKVIYKKALAERLWIFDPSIKRWHTPEDFWENYQRYDNLEREWIDALQIMDPEEGLKAADQQIESIISRKAIFAKRIIDYWKSKSVLRK